MSIHSQVNAAHEVCAALNASRNTQQIAYVIKRKPAEREPAPTVVERQPTSVVLDATLLACAKIRLTDLRITRGWCHGRNVMRVVDLVRDGRTDKADALASIMCGPRRAMLMSYIREDADDDA